MLKEFTRKELSKQLEDVGEGFVVYFEIEDVNILVCKLKGIEYVIE